MISKTRRVALYARVSTDSQTTENQLVELRAVAARAGWEVVAEYVDKGVSGSKGRDGRPQFDKLLKAASRREFDMIASWSVDRLGRSLQHLVSFLGDIQAKGLAAAGLDVSKPFDPRSIPAGSTHFARTVPQGPRVIESELTNPRDRRYMHAGAFAADGRRIS